MRHYLVLLCYCTNDGLGGFLSQQNSVKFNCENSLLHLHLGDAEEKRLSYEMYFAFCLAKAVKIPVFLVICKSLLTTVAFVSCPTLHCPACFLKSSW